LRAWGDKVLVGIVLDAAASPPEFKRTLEGLLGKAELNPKHREAAVWLLATLPPTGQAVANDQQVPPEIHLEDEVA
jgi:hypothetical protein